MYYLPVSGNDVMNKQMIAIGLASLLSMGPLLSVAAEKTADSSAPPTAMPGVNHGGSGSGQDKADKKGEEASGSNSGAESHETQKDAAGSSDGGATSKTAP